MYYSIEVRGSQEGIGEIFWLLQSRRKETIPRLLSTLKHSIMSPIVCRRYRSNKANPICIKPNIEIRQWARQSLYHSGNPPNDLLNDMKLSMHNRIAHAAKLLLGVWMAGVVISVFLLLPSYEGLGDAGRIMVLHVPTAWVSVLAFAVSAFFSGMYLWRGRTIDDDRALAAAESGLLFSILATVTGMIFSQVVWGIYWNWDPRQTSIFVLLLIYAALFALRSALQEAEQRRRLSAVYSIFAFVTVPFLIFIAPRLSESTLHPNCAFLPGSKCDGIELAVGKIGLLGDRKIQLLSLDQQGDSVVAQVKVSEPGLVQESILEPEFDMKQKEATLSPDIPGVRFRLQIKRVDLSTGQALLNIAGPGTGLLDNQRTLLTFLASILGFTGIFVWVFHIRSLLLGVEWDIAQQHVS